MSTASRPVREAHRPQIHGLIARRVRPEILEPVSSTSRGQREQALARYGQAFKDRAVARLLPPESAALDDVSRDVGIGVDTLVRWRSDSMSKPGRERVWTAAARFDAVLTTAAMDEASKSAWCRAHGTYVQQLATWQLRIRAKIRSHFRPCAGRACSSTLAERDDGACSSCPSEPAISCYRFGSRRRAALH